MKQAPRRKRLRLVLASLAWLGLGLASAQTTLDAYTEAKTALDASIAATPDDSVTSLDALRQAKRAFAPLGESLGAPLNQGLQTTFDRAEEAIINASPTDLKVQGAVLYGGFQRGLYEAALRAAQSGDLETATRFLTVLGRDLELTPAQFAGSAGSENAAQSLQLTFETRLAARSLNQLRALRTLPETLATRDARYEALGRLYSHILLIQDSPRLPAAAQTTVLGAIQALIERQTLEPTLSRLQAQLQDFQRASTASQRRLAPTEEPTQSANGNTENAYSASAQVEGPPKTATEVTPATPQDTPAPETEASGSEPAQASTQAATELGTKPGAAPQTNASAPSSAPSATPGLEGGAAASTPAPETDIQAAPTSSVPTPPDTALFGLLTAPVRAYLLIAASLLALVGIVLLLAQAAASPALNIATILLLLPVLAEGLIALGAELEPLVGVPALAQAEQYSLFVNPLMQVLWTLLAIGAGLFLLFTRRSATGQRAGSKSSPTPPVASAGETPPPLSQRPPLSSAGSFNWDEDF